MTQAKRVEDWNHLDEKEICYGKAPVIREGKESFDWWIYFPSLGIGMLTKHNIVEHEDGTITASPSILFEGHRTLPDGTHITNTKHGYLEYGVWRDT
jgi:hypothetical protein